MLAGIGTWITRMWLAERPMAGMNKAAAELAHGRGPGAGVDYVEYWLGRIQRLRNTRVGVPRDEEVQEGIRARKAYGGGATRSAFAVLCELMEAEHGEESPARDRLTIEHVMPQKLTDEWKQALGDDAEETHGRGRDRLRQPDLERRRHQRGDGDGHIQCEAGGVPRELDRDHQKPRGRNGVE